MRALVTGAGGFVGANLVAHLLTGGHEVAAIVRPGGDRWRLADWAGHAELVECDLEDTDKVANTTLRLRPEVIFHLAANGAYSWQQDLDKMLAVNLRCTQVLLDAAVEVGAKLVNAGSSSEYGYKDHAPGEDENPRPNSHYAVTKLGATHLCQLAADKHGIHAVTLRLYSIYGPWEDPGRLMPVLVRAARAGGWPPLTNPGTARDFVWVGDACQAFELAAGGQPGEPGLVLNIASGTQTTLGELVATAAQVFAVDAEPSWGGMEQRAWDTNVWVGDARLALAELDWHAGTTLEQGLQSMGSWFEEHPELGSRYQ